jgi:hypothetical protein
MPRRDSAGNNAYRSQVFPAGGILFRSDSRDANWIRESIAWRHVPGPTLLSRTFLNWPVTLTLKEKVPMLIHFLTTLNTVRRLLRLSALPLVVAGALSCRAGAQVVFTYSGSTTTYMVPAGYNELYVQLWGAGGGDPYGDGGGGGAYVSGFLAVTPNEQLTILVGGGSQGGIMGSGSGGFGGGGSGQGGSGGGGRSAITLGGVDIVDAGGGGGGSYIEGTGGAGGLSVGQAGQPSDSGGGGGTLMMGGAGGAPGPLGQPGTGGVQYQGGSGIAGGGGGYYGGGGGGFNGPDTSAGGGGGGSSLTSNLGQFYGEAGNGQTPGGTTAANYISGVGVGGFMSDGGDGEIVLTPTTPAPGSLPIFAAFASAGSLWVRRRTRGRKR